MQEEQAVTDNVDAKEKIWDSTVEVKKGKCALQDLLTHL